MKNWRWMWLVVVLLLAGCGSPANVLNVEMSEFGFTPNRLIVAAGAPVTINLENSGALEHDFLILELGEQAHTPFKETGAHIYWKARLDARQEQALQFTAPTQPGEYLIVCGVAGHLEQKMQATLTVTP